ncbi:hypothetical protein PM082_021839 [Marasmius tenuissimus]|nr:hypothetical protein PM082_021839 [Marasmius tenuissimus]
MTRPTRLISTYLLITDGKPGYLIRSQLVGKDKRTTRRAPSFSSLVPMENIGKYSIQILTEVLEYRTHSPVNRTQISSSLGSRDKEICTEADIHMD